MGPKEKRRFYISISVFGRPGLELSCRHATRECQEIVLWWFQLPSQRWLRAGQTRVIFLLVYRTDIILALPCEFVIDITVVSVCLYSMCEKDVVMEHFVDGTVV